MKCQLLFLQNLEWTSSPNSSQWCQSSWNTTLKCVQIKRLAFSLKACVASQKYCHYLVIIISKRPRRLVTLFLWQLWLCGMEKIKCRFTVFMCVSVFVHRSHPSQSNSRAQRWLSGRLWNEKNKSGDRPEMQQRQKSNTILFSPEGEKK